jgi:hypothetical protein
MREDYDFTDFWGFTWDLKWINSWMGWLDWLGRPDYATFADILVIDNRFDIVYWIVLAALRMLPYF